MVGAMSDPANELTLENLQARMKAAGIEIAETRLEMVRVLLNTALAPLRAGNASARPALEPAVIFDAGADHGER